MIRSLAPFAYRRTALPLLLLLGSFFLLPTTVLQAQTPDIEWGPTFESGKRGYKIYILGHDGDDIFVLRKEIPGMGANAFSTPKLYFEIYGKDLRRKKEAFVSLEDKKDDYDYETAFRSGGQLWLVSSQIDRKADKRTFYLQPVDPSTLKPGARTPIGYSNATTTLNRMAGTNFAWADAPGGKRLAAMAINRDQSKPEEFAIALFDETLNPLWERRERLRELDKNVEQKQFMVDDMGGVYVLLEVEEKDDISYRMHYYTDGESDPVVFEFDTDQFTPVSVHTEITRPGVVRALGSYADPSRNDGSRWARIKGFYYSEVDLNSGTYLSKTESVFSNAFLTAHLSDKKAEKVSSKDKANTRRFDLRQTIPLADGGMLVLGEQFTSVVGLRFIYIKMYDIVAFRLDATGNLVWAERVAKEQEMAWSHGGGIVGMATADKFTPRDLHSFMRSDMDLDNIYSFGHMVHSDKLWVFFNDDPKNLEDSDKRRVLKAATKKMYLVGVSMDLATGKQEKHLIFDAKQEDARARPALGEQLDNNRYLFFSSLRKELQPVMLEW